MKQAPAPIAAALSVVAAISVTISAPSTRPRCTLIDVMRWRNSSVAVPMIVATAPTDRMSSRASSAPVNRLPTIANRPPAASIQPSTRTCSVVVEVPIAGADRATARVPADGGDVRGPLLM